MTIPRRLFAAICSVVMAVTLGGAHHFGAKAQAASVARSATTAPAPLDTSKSKWWSLQPIRKPVIPSVQHFQWVQNPIDAFVLSRLETQGLHPAPRADRTTLIRRATFDLLGLPPTPQEVRDFVTDPATDAYEKLIDRLLASPHYGERWGRHWLDIARYVPGRITFPGIKRTSGDQAYRDYVVRAFNEDKPYDRFVLEQLAGDLLPEEKDQVAEFDRITAPAFLSIGAWFDQCTDPNRLKLEMVDDMVSTSGQAFLGMTVGCARCHDHKFDPIPTADYYALAGIFQSTRIVGAFSDYWRDGRTRLLRPLAMPAQVAENNRLLAQVETKKAERWKLLSDEREKLVKRATAHLADYQQAARELPALDVHDLPAAEFDGQHNLRIAQLQHNGSAVDLIETLNPTETWVKYTIEVPVDGRYQLAALYSSDESNPLTVQVNGDTVSTRALGEATGGWDFAYQRWSPVASFDFRKGLNFLRISLHEGSFPRVEAFRYWRINDDAIQRGHVLAVSRGLSSELLDRYLQNSSSPWPSVAEMASFIEGAGRQALLKLDEDLRQLNASMTPYDLIVSVTDQSAPVDLPVHMRGDTYHVAAQAVPRGVPHFADACLNRPAIPQGESGRLELARWIVDARNPLPARVLVNRLWQWHFGTGIVATPSDFGARGSLPSNPALLDYLAATLVERGWSIKQMHKLIMTSNAYQSQCAADEASAEADPSLLAHFVPRRLDAEELYDAMLVTINNLPPQPAGGPLNLEKAKNRAMYVLAANRSPKGLGTEVRRMFPLFDDDATGASIAVRGTSATPAQSLFWLNSPLVNYFAGRFAERLLKMEKLDDAKRFEMAHRIALGRAPSADVASASSVFLKQAIVGGATPMEAWTRLCHALYASEEFHVVQ